MPLNIEVTQFPGGIGDQADNSILNGVGSPLNANGSIAIEDFSGGENYLDHYTNVAITAPAVASVQPSANGVVRFTTPGVATQGTALEGNAATTHVDGFFIAAGVPGWITTRINMLDAVVNGFILGFVPGGSAFAPAAGVYLQSVAASGDVNLIVEGAAQEVQLIGTLAAGATGFIDIALFWDGIKASGQFPGGGGSFIPSPANLPAVGLNGTLTMIEGAGGATTFDVDLLAFGGGR
tara:strand:- start:5060 stop:5770 length:711 start_codon:yes stop_codon:yes gene_type:complete